MFYAGYTGEVFSTLVLPNSESKRGLVLVTHNIVIYLNHFSVPFTSCLAYRMRIRIHGFDVIPFYWITNTIILNLFITFELYYVRYNSLILEI